MEVTKNKVYAGLNGHHYWINYDAERRTINLPATGDLDAKGVVDLLILITSAQYMANMLRGVSFKETRQGDFFKFTPDSELGSRATFMKVGELVCIHISKVEEYFDGWDNDANLIQVDPKTRVIPWEVDCGN